MLTYERQVNLLGWDLTMNLLMVNLTTRGGGTAAPLGRPWSSSVAYLYHTIQAWGIGGDDVGLIQSAKAPKHQENLSLSLNSADIRTLGDSRGDFYKFLV